MARISGIDLPREKKIKFALCYIYGIGQTLASKILDSAKVDPNIRVKDLTSNQATSIRDIISSLTVEGELRTENTINIILWGMIVFVATQIISRNYLRTWKKP